MTLIRCCDDAVFAHLPPDTVTLKCCRHGFQGQAEYRSIRLPGISAHYVATDAGQIVSFHHPIRVLSTERHYRSGHLRVALCGPGRRVDRRRVRAQVHRLVCLAWHGPPPDPDAMALHGPDHDPTNNKPSNLRWGSFKENMADREAQRRALRELLCPELRLSREADEAVALLERPVPTSYGYTADLALGF